MHEILSDKGTHYYIKRGKRRHKITRYPCIGGPFDGQLKSTQEINIEWSNWRDNPYTPFNNAGMSSYTMIFLHDDLLYPEKT